MHGLDVAEPTGREVKRSGSARDDGSQRAVGQYGHPVSPL